MLKKVCVFLILFCVPFAAFAGCNGTSSNWYRKGWWGVNDVPVVPCINDYNANEFWIDRVAPVGNFPRGHGTHGDEGAGIAMIARAALIVESNGGNYGALFCPTQIQAANRNKSYTTWVTYYAPVSNGAGDGCFWLCSPGRSGAWCRDKATDMDACNKTLLLPKELRGRFGFKTSGGDSGSVESTDWMLHRGNYRHGTRGACNGLKEERLLNAVCFYRETEIVFGVTKYLPTGHGVIAEPVALAGTVDTYKNNSSIILAMGGFAQKNTLCMPGYAGQDCAETSLKCIEDNLCSGYSVSKFVRGTHILGNNTPEKCNVIRCADTTKCMNADYSCVGYAEGFEGPDPNTGRCLKCEGAQIFDAAQGCIAADLKSKEDVKKCYMTSSLDEFRDCLKNGKPSPTFFPPPTE
jgi:hypothetical protein